MNSAFPIALVSLLATLTYLIIFIALHFLPTGYNPIRHAVSDYAVGKYGYLFRIALWASSLGVLTLAISLAIGVGAPPLGTRDLILLGLVAFTRIAMTLFPTDLEGDHLTRTGILHYVFAILTFAFVYSFISNQTSILVALNPWQQAKEPLTALAWLVLPALILVVVTMFRSLRRIFGLFERIFLLTTNVWFIIVAFLLLVKTF